MPSLNDFQIGNQFLVKKKFEDAIQAFECHSQEFPDEAAKCFERIAEACYRNRKPQECENYYRRSLEIDPELFRSLLGLANILPDCSDEKLILMERAANLQSNYLLSINIGDFYRTCRKDPEKALLFYEKAWKINPKDKGSYQKVWALCSITNDTETSARWSQLYNEFCK